MLPVETKKPTSRRTFLKWTGFSGLGLFWRPRLSRLFPEGSRVSFLDQIGVCRSLADQKILEAGGCTYVEESVRGFLIPEEPDEKFQAKLLELKSSRLPVRACNGFLPGLESRRPRCKPCRDPRLRRNGAPPGRQRRDQNHRLGKRGIAQDPGRICQSPGRRTVPGVGGQVAPLAARTDVVLALEPLIRGDEFHQQPQGGSGDGRGRRPS